MGLVDFLIEAKKFRFSKKNGVWVTTNDGAEEFSFSSGDMWYRERVFGKEDFAGQVVVWKSRIPFWAMNYFGRVDDLRKEEVYEFLREALIEHIGEEASEDMEKIRGPKNYENKGLVYLHEFKTTPEEIVLGKEQIRNEEKTIYQFFYNSGFLK